MKPSVAAQQVIADTDADVLPFTGSKEAIRQTFKRAQKKAFPIPTAPSNFATFQIADPYDKTISGDRFLLSSFSIGKFLRSLGARIQYPA